ncbi:GAF and ANTAR domain-containing protein [Geodermatophilus sp. SYSU D00697]
MAAGETRGVSGGPGLPLDELSRISLAAQPLSAALTRIAQLAREAVPGAAAASVTLIERGEARSVGVTGPLAAALDERQYATGFGPCMEAALTGAPVLIEDTSDEAVHRDFAVLARRLGVTSVLSVGLPLEHRLVGSLNVYCAGGRLDGAAAELVTRFAHHASVTVDNAAQYAGATDLVAQLRTALESRAVIEQAKGVLMERHGCTPDEAFERLVTKSQRKGRKLRLVAADLVASVQPHPGRGPQPGSPDPAVPDR